MIHVPHQPGKGSDTVDSQQHVSFYVSRLKYNLLMQIKQTKLVFSILKHGEISGEFFWTARKAMPR